MTLDEHVNHLGGLVGNFQSLEFSLRAFLQGLPTAQPIGLPQGANIYSFPVGTELPENELTSYDSLGDLIEKFNAEMKRRSFSGIEPTLVEVRDALAQGRVSALSMNDNLRLLKFDKRKNGKVGVVFNEKLTEAWFARQKKRVYEAIEFVANTNL
jgi:hypothetical protein